LLNHSPGQLAATLAAFGPRCLGSALLNSMMLNVQPVVFNAMMFGHSHDG
jgi:hypothetical protein